MKASVETEKDDEESISSNTFEIKSKVLQREHRIYLSDAVEDDSCSYIDLIHFLGEVKKNDLVHLHLANYGGDCHVGFRLCNAVKQCKAEITTEIDGPCYSMGAILALTGDKIKFNHGTFLMFHNYSTWTGGKGNEFLTSAEAFNKHFYTNLMNLCSPFLNKAEINKLKSDQDVYVHYNEENIDKRIARHFPKTRK